MVYSVRDPMTRKPRQKTKLYWGKRPIRKLLLLLTEYNLAVRSKKKKEALEALIKIARLKENLTPVYEPKTWPAPSVLVFNTLESTKEKIAKILDDRNEWASQTRQTVKAKLQRAHAWIDELSQLL
ncbi:MAG TPA: hypothetical protein VH595_03145 [Verrucomicrobiae bacterium]|nr:hypothetical protein [Verrucomicrobiae bacterium]